MDDMYLRRSSTVAGVNLTGGGMTDSGDNVKGSGAHAHRDVDDAVLPWFMTLWRDYSQQALELSLTPATSAVNAPGLITATH